MGSNALGLVLRRGKSNSLVRVKGAGPAERVSQAGRTNDSTMQFFWTDDFRFWPIAAIETTSVRVCV
jgi:hypothetical protein